MRAWFAGAGLLGALLVGPALAQDEALPLGLDPVTERIWREGQDHEAAGRLAEAAVRYRAVARSDVGFVDATVALARVLAAQGDKEGALAATSRSAVPEVLAVRGGLLLELGRPGEAAEVFRRLWSAAPSAEALRLRALAAASVDPMEAADLVRTWLAWEEDDAAMGLPEGGPSEAVATVVAVVDALVEAGRPEEALVLLDDVVAERPELVEHPVLATIESDLRLDDEARRLMRAAPQSLSPEARSRLADAEAALRAGDDESAWRTARRLAEDNPRSPEAWGVVARVARARGDVVAADDALQRADRLAPLDPRYAAELGDLLSTAYGGRYTREAAAAYARALRRDPTWSDLWWRKAAAEAGAGDVDAQARSLERYLRLEPQGDHAAKAREILEGLATSRPPEPVLPASPERPPGVPEAAWLALHRALVLQGRGDIDAALVAVAEARAEAPGWARAMNLEAALHIERGDPDAAVAAYRRSLAADPDQALPYLVLWEILEQRGDVDDAARVLEDAVARGVGDVHYGLARQALAQGRVAAARAHLDAYAAADRRTGRYDAEVRALRAELDRRERRRRGVYLGVGGAALLGVATVAWLRRPGVDLATLVVRAPTTAREVARIAAAVRHEVLKHDTTVLGAVADALEGGDPEPARFAAARLFGPRGTLVRLREHVDELHGIARAHGVRLDLWRSDPVFAPLLAAARRLHRLRRDLERGRSRCVPELRRVARALNDTGFSDLGRLVRSLSLLTLDEALVRGVVTRVRQEPGLAGAPEVRVDVRATPTVRMFRGAAEDILANIVRNSLQASRDAGVGPVVVRVDTQVDPITFREDAVLAVLDHAPGRLTTSTLRGRFSERGLGIVVDLVNRADGTIEVQPADGWAKAVVVRLPAVEHDEEGAA